MSLLPAPDGMGSLDLVSGMLSRVPVASPEMLRSGNLLGLLFPNSTLTSSRWLFLFRDPFLAFSRFFFLSPTSQPLSLTLPRALPLPLFLFRGWEEFFLGWWDPKAILWLSKQHFLVCGWSKRLVIPASRPAPPTSHHHIF